MTSSAISHGALGNVVHDPSLRRRVNRVGLWTFILSEAFLFAALLSSRFVVTGFERPHEVNQSLGLLITGVLLVSSLTAYRSEMFASTGNRAGLKRNLLFTIGLALVFVAGVVIEWVEGFQFFPPRTAYGTMFFTLTGLHALHVISGALCLLVAYSYARRGSFGPGDYWGVEGVAKYWHFVDLAWVFIYPTLYLVG